MSAFNHQIRPRALMEDGKKPYLRKPEEVYIIKIIEISYLVVQE